MSGNIVFNNRQLLLNELRKSGPISKQALREKTELGWATVSREVNKLVDSEYVMLCGKDALQEIGRKAEEYDINDKKNYFIGIDLNNKGILFVVTDLKGRIIKQCQTEIVKWEQRESVLNKMFEIVDGFFKDYSYNNIIGIGIGAQGIVDMYEGISVYISKIEDWKDVPIKKIFEERYGVDVHLLHDPDCLMKSEIVLGGLEGQNIKNAFSVNVNFGIGIGMAIMINEQMYHGWCGKAGEIGMTFVGEYPDWHNMLSNHLLKEEILKEYINITGVKNEPTYKQFTERLEAGDEVCREIYRGLGKKIGMALTTSCNLLNPQVIIINLSTCACKEFLFEEIKKVIIKYVQEANVEIKLSRLHDNAVAIGSALTVIEKTIQSV